MQATFKLHILESFFIFPSSCTNDCCKNIFNTISYNKYYNCIFLKAGSDVTQSSEPKVNIFEYSENTRRWNKTETIAITEPVHDIAFAPNVGRSYHVLAVASKDVSIYNLNPVLSGSNNGSRFDVQPVHNHLTEHFSTVWRYINHSLTNDCY